MRILVTGGSGFLGSRLIDELVKREHNTMNFDRALDDMWELAAPDRFWHAIETLEDPPTLVVHSAGMPGRRFCEDDARQARHDNIIATTEVAQACRRLAIPLVFFSTSEVYGTSCDAGQVDESSPLAPRNTYARTKVAGEQIVAHYLAENVTIIRPAMAYGPGMDVGYGRAALPTFVANALAKAPSQAHSGTARSWCYVDDLVRGLADVVELHDGRIYNVGRDDDMIDSYHLAASIYSILHADITLISDALPDETITPSKDISCARLRALGWAPTISLNEGIRRTADWLREQS